MNSRRSPAPWLVTAFLCGVVVTWALTPARPPAPSPWSPVPDPHVQRPVVAAIVRLAKQLGWVLVFSDPAPGEPTRPAASQRAAEAAEDEQCEIGADGYPVCRNGHGW